jgi:hypothetical protein
MIPQQISKSPSAKNRPPVLKALVSLLVSGALTGVFILLSSHYFDLRYPLSYLLAGMGFLAAFIGFSFGLARWWGLILLVFPSALGAALLLNVPAWVYLFCFFALLIVYWNAAGERVPLFLTNARTWNTLDTLIEDSTHSFIDIGCGVGGVLTYLARRHPDIQFTGIESAPIPWLISKLRVRLLGLKNVSIHFQNMWAENLQYYDIVYCFLSPEPMERLFNKAKTEMQAGSKFVSNSFTVAGIEANTIIDVDDSRKTRLHVWIL